jgi:glycosyltransferase involved in cell wall biosynthesis
MTSVSDPAATVAPRLAIVIAAPYDRVAARWGDWHLACALARALERQGCVVLVRSQERADEPDVHTCDVRIDVLGRQPAVRVGDQPRVSWIISHPELVEARTCDRVDLVLVASARFAAELAPQTSTPVEVLLQATDPHRFRPVAPVARVAHSVVVVAKSRDVHRSMVVDAVRAGLRPAIFGSGWDGIVDPDLVIEEHVANAELPGVYSSAGVVLNDHWPTMREWGFVSNRVFDVVACGTPVVSDVLPELGELFGAAVTTFDTPDELGIAVERALDDPGVASRVDTARLVVAEQHSFDRRAETVLRLARQHGLLADA